MEKRETFKIIELNGRKWRIGKFDALTGSYIAYKLLFQALPMGLDSQIGNLPKGRETMSKDEFLALQRDCLSICQELKNVGGVDTPMVVMMPDGRWGVDGLQDDTVTVLALTAHALIFNVASFFEGDALKGLIDSFQGLNLFNAKI